MLANMTPEEYEKFCGKLISLFWHIIVIAVLSFILTFANVVFLHYGLGMSIPINIYLSIAPAIILSTVLVVIGVSVKKYRLYAHPFIYWWILVFGHRMVITKFLKNETFFKRYTDESVIKNKFGQIFKDEDFGLFYIDFKYIPGYGSQVICKTTEICFASKSRALLALMKIPEKGYSID